MSIATTSEDDDNPILVDSNKKSKQNTQIVVTDVPGIRNEHPVVLSSKDQDEVLNVWNGDSETKAVPRNEKTGGHDVSGSSFTIKFK